MDSEESSLRSQINRIRSQFTDRLGKDFETKRRATDMRQVFTMAVRRKYKTLTFPWLQKHSSLARHLFTTYDNPQLLRQMIDRYVDHDEYHRERGISFDGFYYCAAKLATDIAALENKAIAVEQREKITAQPDLVDADVQAFKNSPFFKRMPKIFQEKIDGGT